MRLRIIGGVMLVLILGACATIPPSQDDEKVLELIDRFNTSSGPDLVSHARLPFLFGDEILYTAADLSAVIRRVKEAGLVLTPDITGSTSSIAIAGTERFDVQVFADELPPDTRQLLVPSTAGRVTILVGGEADGVPLLLGIQREDS